MKKLKRFTDVLPLLLLWLMLSVFLWGFVFVQLTDAPAAEKLVIFADAALTDETGLAVLLEEGAADPVRMVQVRAFSYAMMGGDAIENADLYIVSAAEAETYREWFAPLPAELQRAGDVLEMDGVPCGVKIWDAASASGAAAAYINYAPPGQAAQDYYLFVGRNSLHVQDHENAVDHQAVSCALRLLDIP